MEWSVGMNVAKKAPWHGIPSLQLVDADLRRVEDVIHRTLSAPKAAGELSNLLDYFASRSGKMLRPGLVLLSGACFGPATDKHIQVAAVVEMIHGATLLHDDVMDDGRTRRGAATVNCIWGNDSAVLLGDFVLSQVFRMTADLEVSTAKVLAETAIHVCEGELRQAVQKHNWDLDESQYMSIITDKSAAFFSGCCRLGAMLAAAAQDQVDALAHYGLYAGIAFQMTDDVLDILASEFETGKTAQNDLASSKPTLPLIHLLRCVDASVKDSLYEMFETPRAFNGELREMLLRYGSLDYARATAQEYVRKATEALDPLPPGRAKEALKQTAHFLADRAA
jgi:octaprenyl-diphosphate synthase